MGIFDFFKKRQNEETNNKTSKNKKEIKNEIKDDKSFHPEILFFINKDDAEYVDFGEA